jgi:DNA-binding HxlR family transcriptional regulator
VLLTGLDYFVSLGLDNPAMTPKILSQRFDELEETSAAARPLPA